MPPNHLILCRPLLLLSSILPSIRVFSNSRLFTSGGQSTGASASASVLPMKIQDWFPLGLTGLISLQSKDSQESSPTPQFQTTPRKCYSVIKKVWNNATCYNILERPLGHSNWRKSEWKRQVSYGITYAENVKLIQNWKRLTDFKTQLSDTDGITLEVRNKSESWS